MKFANEAAFLSAVVDLFKMAGWHVHHDRLKQNVLGHAGFPDIVAAKRWRVIFAELKMEKGMLSQEQLLWLETLGGSQGPHEVYVWRPGNWDEIVRKVTQ